jgi:hypothetical protein
MSRPTIYAAITNHGFGHTTRMASVLAALQALRPDVLIILVTTASRPLLESYLTGDFIVRPRPLDVGIVQPDGIVLDQASTLEKLHHLQARQQQIIQAEVQFIEQNRVGLVVGDIPPLAAALARQAGIPCWMMGNFGWDFIYRPWGGGFEAVADWISGCYGQVDRLFRLPFHEPMAAFPQMMDVGLTGGDPRFALKALEEHLGITAPRHRTVLLTFGGLGLGGLPYDQLARFPEWQFITFDRQAPPLPNLISAIAAPPLEGYRLRPVDVMPRCHCVISKPGYSTFAEAVRVGLPVVTITREGFAEAPLLLQGLQRCMPHRIVEAADFLSQPWDFLESPLVMPANPETISHDGNGAIAGAIAEFFS